MHLYLTQFFLFAINIQLYVEIDMFRESVLTAFDILSVLKKNSVGCVKHSVKIHENEDEKCFQIIISDPRTAGFKVVKSSRCRQK